MIKKLCLIVFLIFILFQPISIRSLAIAGTIQLPQTGQKTCYNTMGDVVPCTGTGQDGDIRAGVAWPNPRFIDNGNQTVTDKLTGLVWVKDGNLMKTRDSGFDMDYLRLKGSCYDLPTGDSNNQILSIVTERTNRTIHPTNREKC